MDLGCTVCNKPFDLYYEEQISALPCGHVFHDGCLDHHGYCNDCNDFYNWHHDALELDLSSISQDTAYNFRKKIKELGRSIYEKNQKIGALNDQLKCNDAALIQMQEVAAQIQAEIKATNDQLQCKDATILQLQEDARQREAEINATNYQLKCKDAALLKMQDVAGQMAEQIKATDDQLKYKDATILQMQQDARQSEAENNALSDQLKCKDATLLQIQEVGAQREAQIKTLEAESLRKDNQVMELQAVIGALVDINKSKKEEIANIRSLVGNSSAANSRLSAFVDSLVGDSGANTEG